MASGSNSARVARGRIIGCPPAVRVGAGSVLLVAKRGDRVLFLHDGTMDPESALLGGGFSGADVFRRLQELGI